MQPLISACMIVRDEGACLPRCLSSIRDAVDEVIVVDTGSRDTTREIARSLGAELFTCIWEDDFSTPRNVSLIHAHGDWILTIDADEQLAPAARHDMRQLVQNKDVLGYRILLEMHPEWTPQRSLRLFRNTPLLRFKGVYHEELTVPGESREKIIPADLRIVHTPFTEESRKRKYARNVRLLRKHLNRYPDDVYQMLDLAGLHLETAAVQEAERLLQRARKLIFNDDPDCTAEKLKMCRALYYHLQGRFLLKTNNAVHERLAVCRDAMAALPGCPLFYYSAAHLYYALRQYETAIAHFKKCLCFGTRGTPDLSISYPRDILTSRSLAGLGHCYFKTRKYAAAACCFRAVLEHGCDDNSRVMLASARLLGSKSSGCLSQRSART